MVIFLLLSLAHAGLRDAVADAVSKPPAGTVVVEVGGDDGSIDPGDRAHLTLTNGGRAVSELLAADGALKVLLGTKTETTWGYTAHLPADALAGTSLRLPLVPEANEPYPDETYREGTLSISEHLQDVGPPGTALTVSVATWSADKREWITVARAPITWNLDRAAIISLQNEQAARFRAARADANTWPQPASQDAKAKALAGSLVSRAVAPDEKVIGWNLGSTGWVLVRNSLGVVIQDQWNVNIGFQHGSACWLGEVKMVREYIGSTPQKATITGTSTTTARPIRCDAIGGP